MLGNTYETFPANHTRATCAPDTLEASMGLLDSLKSTFTSSGEASVPPAASFATREGVIYAPVNGVLVNLSEVPDETIASGMLGQGYGIEPITGTIYAPANGRIGATTVTNHSIGMITEDGLRVFIHVGLGTVEMNGKGFARFVEMGDEVKAGQPLISFDREAIKAAGESLQSVAYELAQVVYADAQQQTDGAAGAQPADDDVVDADYEVVDDDKDNK